MLLFVAPQKGVKEEKRRTKIGEREVVKRKRVEGEGGKSKGGRRSEFFFLVLFI